MSTRNLHLREYVSPNDAAKLFPDDAKAFRVLYETGKVLGFKRPGGRGDRLYLRVESIRDYYRALEAESWDREQANGTAERPVSRRERYQNDPGVLALRAAKAAAGAGAV